MEGLRVDFSMQRGHEMLISREPELLREEMDDIDMAMLQSHRAPGLLAADWLEVDGKLTFGYTVTGRKMLSQRLQLKPLHMRDYYALLLGVVDVLDGCRPNLLREEAVLLHEEYLFVGREFSDIQAAYLPLRQPAAGKSVREVLQLLAVRWVARVGSVDGAGLRHVLQLVESGMSWTDMRSELLRLIAGGGGMADRITADGGTAAAAGVTPGIDRLPPARETAGAGYRIKPAASGPTKPEEGVPHETEATGDGGLAAGAERPEAEVPLPGGRWLFGGRRPGADDGPFGDYAGGDDSGWLEEPPDFTAAGKGGRTARGRWVAGAAAALIAAAIWRTTYAAQPTGKQMLLAMGLTALTAAGLAAAWKRLSPAAVSNKAYDEEEAEWNWRARSDGEPNHPLAAGLVPFAGSPPAGDAVSAERPQQGTDSAWAEPAASAASRHTGAAAPPDESLPPAYRPAEWAGSTGSAAAAPGAAGGGVAHTELRAIRPPAAAGSEETVALAPRPLPKSAEVLLERSWKGEVRQMPLGGDATVIGRSAESAGIRDEAEGLSRAHLELLCTEAGMQARDLGSRNGSLLNGEAMVPYKLYPVKGGDEVRLAGGEGPLYRILAR